MLTRATALCAALSTQLRPPSVPISFSARATTGTHSLSARATTGTRRGALAFAHGCALARGRALRSLRGETHLRSPARLARAARAYGSGLRSNVLTFPIPSELGALTAVNTMSAARLRVSRALRISDPGVLPTPRRMADAWRPNACGHAARCTARLRTPVTGAPNPTFPYFIDHILLCCRLLSSNFLSGTIPSELGRLTALPVL